MEEIAKASIFHFNKAYHPKQKAENMLRALRTPLQNQNRARHVLFTRNLSSVKFPKKDDILKKCEK